MSEIKESEPEQSEKEILEVFQALRQEVTQIFTKINELENEKAEHVATESMGRNAQGLRTSAKASSDEPGPLGRPRPPGTEATGRPATSAMGMAALQMSFFTVPSTLPTQLNGRVEQSSVTDSNTLRRGSSNPYL